MPSRTTRVSKRRRRDLNNLFSFQTTRTGTCLITLSITSAFLGRTRWKCRKGWEQRKRRRAWKGCPIDSCRTRWNQHHLPTRTNRSKSCAETLIIHCLATRSSVSLLNLHILTVRLTFPEEQKDPQVGDDGSMFSVSSEKTYLIVVFKVPEEAQESPHEVCYGFSYSGD